MSALRIGIVGARFAADLHAVNYRPLIPTRVRLAAVCSRTRADVETFAKHHDREGLHEVIRILRRARNEVVWKLGQ